jgi:hypothetical protein
MRDKIDFKSCFKLLYEIANNPVLNYKCENNQDGCIIKVDEDTLSVNNIFFESFLGEIDNSFKTGMTKLKDKLNNMPEEDSNKMIHDFLREKRNCKSLIYTGKTVKEFRYRYFSKEKYNTIEKQKNNNLRTWKPKWLHELGDNLQMDSPIESYNRIYLRVCFSPFCDLYIDKLESLEIELGALNALIRIPESKNKKYELTIGKGYSSKELVYLINVLTRIDFFVIGSNDHTKLFNLIADLYRSQRDEDSDKYSNVKKCWADSERNRITNEFCKKFEDKVIGRMKQIIVEDKSMGYNPSRKGKKL